MYIYAVPARGAASGRAAGLSLGVARLLFSNVSNVWGVTAWSLLMETARRCCRSVTTTTITTPVAVAVNVTLTTPNSTARSPKSNHAVSLLPPRPLQPPPPPSSATATYTILIISNTKVWELSGWWRENHARRGKNDTHQVGEIRCGNIKVGSSAW